MADPFKLGNKFFSAKKYPRAIKKFTEALEQDPADEEAAAILTNRSAAYTLLQEYDLGEWQVWNQLKASYLTPCSLQPSPMASSPPNVVLVGQRRKSVSPKHTLASTPLRSQTRRGL